MNYVELTKAVAEESGLSQKDAKAALDAFLKVSTAALKGGDEVVLQNFGKFSASRSEARTGRNPSTGKSIEIAASNSARFKASSVLKKAIN